MKVRDLQRIALLSLVVPGLLATGCEREVRDFADTQAQRGRVSLYNQTNDVVTVRIQSLGRFYGVDCEIVAADPSRYLLGSHLTNPSRRYLLSGFEVAVQNAGEEANRSEGEPCRISVLTPEDNRMDPIAVTWPTSLPTKAFYTDVDAPPDLLPEPATVMITADYSGSPPADVPSWRNRPCGGQVDTCSESEAQDVLSPTSGAQYAWDILGTEPQIYAWSPRDPASLSSEENDPQCTTGRNRTPLAWNSPPQGQWEIQDVYPVSEGLPPLRGFEPADGQSPRCFEVLLGFGGPEFVAWIFCGSQRLADRLDPEGRRDFVSATFFAENRTTAGVAYENLTIDIQRTAESGVLNEVETIELVRGQSIPDHIGLTWAPAAQTTCEPIREIPGCEQVVLPNNLKVEISAGILEVRPGETVNLSSDPDQPVEHLRRLELVRGMHRVVTHPSCAQMAMGSTIQAGSYVELIYYSGVTVLAD